MRLGRLRTTFVTASFCVAAGLGAVPARAATVEFTAGWRTWIEPYRAVAAGDTVRWSWTSGHNVVLWAGDITIGHDSLIGKDHERTFHGGTVLFRCTVLDHSVVSDNGLCGQMCGGYTDRPAPSAPVVDAPASGASVHGPVSLIGTALPWTYVSVRDTVHFYGDIVLADRLGNWTLRAMPKGTGLTGPYTFSVVATDILGRASPVAAVAVAILSEAPVTTDRVFPSGQITADTTSVATEDEITFQGRATDNVGVTGVWLDVYRANTRVRTVEAFCADCGPHQSSVAFSVSVTTGMYAYDLQPGLYSVSVKTTDAAGNIAHSQAFPFAVATSAGAQAFFD